MLDTRHALMRARFVLCLVGGLIWCAAAVSCARIVERYPAAAIKREPDHTEAKKYRPPPGAECRSRRTVDENTDEPCDSDAPPSWPAWSDPRPPGVCYALDEPCEGVPDHVAYLTFDDGPID